MNEQTQQITDTGNQVVSSNPNMPQENVYIGDPSLDVLIDQAVHNTSKETPIILINNNPNSPDNPTTVQFLSTSTNINFGPMSAEEFREEIHEVVISFKRIDYWIELADKIGNLFEGNFNELPSTKSEGQSGAQKAASVIAMYAKMSSFVKSAASNKDILVEELNNLKSEILEIKISFDDFLDFYDIADQFNKVRISAESYSKTDNKYAELIKVIKDTSLRFASDQKVVVAAITDLTKLGEYFVQEISKLKDMIGNNSLKSALVNFDKALKSIIKLLEMRVDIQAALLKLKNGLSDIKGYKELLDKVLDDIKNLNETHAKQDAPAVLLSQIHIYQIITACLTVTSVMVF